MDPVDRHFRRALRKVPAIVVGVLAADRVEITPLGTVANDPAPDSLCWEAGSITKVFTGLLLAEMSLRGEVGLDDPIGRYLPVEVATHLPEAALQPTLTHLATHTAGLPRLPWAIYRRARSSDDPYSGLTESDVFACLGPKTRRPRRPRSRYSNFGMGLLGHLLARAGGRPYETLLTERILSPLGLAATGVGRCAPGGSTVQGYRKGKPVPPWTFGALEGAGALRSTVHDLLTFARTCLDPPSGTIGEALELARRPFHQGRLPFPTVGLGWMLRTRDRKERRAATCWHDGGTYGGASFLAVDTERRIAVVTVGNAGPRLMPPLNSPSWALFDSLCP